jgi:hypothetical protein
VTVIVDQPSPIATDRRPSWEIVMSYVDQIRTENAYGSSGVVARVLTDMRERDVVGRQRYGVPLTSGNGRDHLVDAYQEYQDACVYLVTALDEHGAGPATLLDEDLIPDRKLRWHLHCVQQMFAAQVRALIQLRALIEERASAS